MNSIKPWIHIYVWFLLLGTWRHTNSVWLLTNLTTGVLGYSLILMAHFWFLDRKKFEEELHLTQVTGKDCIGEQQSNSFWLCNEGGLVLVLFSTLSSCIYMILDVFR